MLQNYLPKLAGALATLVIGWVAVGVMVNLVRRALHQSNIEPTLKPFICTIVSMALKVSLLISVASMVGIQTTSFVAILGAAGLAVGMALQGSLGNFAGGVLILIFKPFKVGDVITAQGETGSVVEISLFTTKLKSPDNQITYIPNGALSSGVIKNITQEPTRRVDITFGIGYEDDIDKARAVIKETIMAHPKVLQDKGIDIFVVELADSSVNLSARVWSHTADYWDIKFSATESVKKALDRAGISIPFPQRDVHLHQVQN